jgi:hypothetical protein
MTVEYFLKILFQQGFTIILCACFGFMSAGLGWFFLEKVPLRFQSFKERLFFSTVTGFGILGYAIFILGCLQILIPSIISITLVILFVFSLAGWWNLRFHFSHSSEPKEESFWEKFAAVLLTASIAAAFLLVLTPETGKDALIYHLAVPKLFLKHQGFYFIPGNIFANYPLHSEMLFLVGLFLNGDTLAKGMHFLALLCLLLGIWQFIRARSEHAYPVLSVVIFFTIPTVFITSHTANNDLFITLYSVAAVFAFLNWHEYRQEGWIVFCGIFSGLAVACKYTALILPMLGFLGILLLSYRRNDGTKITCHTILLYVLALLITGSPFYLKNWILTDNPFYPFLSGIFGGRGWEPEQARSYDLFVSSLGMGRTWMDYLLLPWNVSLRAELSSPRFDGLLGPMFILIIPFAIGIRRISVPMKVITVYCIITFMFWASSAQQLRYLIPIFPFLAIITGSILAFYRKRALLFGILSLIIAGSLAFNMYHISRDFFKAMPVGVVIGTESREAYLGRMLPSYNMFRFVNMNLPPDSRIFLIYMKNWTFLCDQDCYSDSMFESYTIQKILAHASTPASAAGKLKAMGFTHILCDERYIYGISSVFSEDEKTAFSRLEKGYLQLIRSEGPYHLYSLI